jgi:hypothetical protein
LAEIEHIDDEADGAGINFVKIDDKQRKKWEFSLCQQSFSTSSIQRNL